MLESKQVHGRLNKVMAVVRVLSRNTEGFGAYSQVDGTNRSAIHVKCYLGLYCPANSVSDGVKNRG